MNSLSGRGGAPRSRQYSSKPAHSSRLARRYSSRNASHPERSSAGSPEKVGGRSGSLSSRGLQETIRTQGMPEAGIAGKEHTLSSTITSGRSSSKISRRRSSPQRGPHGSEYQGGSRNYQNC